MKKKLGLFLTMMVVVSFLFVSCDLLGGGDDSGDTDGTGDGDGDTTPAFTLDDEEVMQIYETAVNLAQGILIFSNGLTAEDPTITLEDEPVEEGVTVSGTATLTTTGMDFNITVEVVDGSDTLNQAFAGSVSTTGQMEVDGTVSITLTTYNDDYITKTITSVAVTVGWIDSEISVDILTVNGVNFLPQYNAFRDIISDYYFLYQVFSGWSDSEEGVPGIYAMKDLVDDAISFNSTTATVTFSGYEVSMPGPGMSMTLTGTIAYDDSGANEVYTISITVNSIWEDGGAASDMTMAGTLTIADEGSFDIVITSVSGGSLSTGYSLTLSVDDAGDFTTVTVNGVDQLDTLMGVIDMFSSGDL
ncbi:MAG: hypothetical protein JXR86_18430 [Spirochaetales bacterium]|nr:hypothetical protein [Spirochaetales bacterium]